MGLCLKQRLLHPSSPRRAYIVNEVESLVKINSVDENNCDHIPNK
jgi:hypothetical protein